MVSAPCWLRPQPVRSSGAMSLNGLVMGLSLAGAIAPVERRHLAPYSRRRKWAQVRAGFAHSLYGLQAGGLKLRVQRPPLIDERAQIVLGQRGRIVG